MVLNTSLLFIIDTNLFHFKMKSKSPIFLAFCISSMSVTFSLALPSGQKQPCRGIVKKMYSENMQQIQANMLQSNFIKITLRHWCSSVNLLHIFKTPFPKNTFGWLLLTWLILHFSKMRTRWSDEWLMMPSFKHSKEYQCLCKRSEGVSAVL